MAATQCMDDVAAQTILGDDFCKSKRAAFFNALKRKTGLTSPR
jgi:hypothetical protein